MQKVISSIGKSQAKSIEFIMTRKRHPVKKILDHLTETPAMRAERLKIEGNIKLRSKVFGKGVDRKCPKASRRNWRKEI